MEARIEMFRGAVALVFNNWTALRLAAEQHIGLPQGKEMALKFVDHVVEVLTNQEGMDWEDVADLLEDIMDSQFETFCDDNSTEEVGMMLCQLYQQCVSGDTAAVELEMAKLPKCQLWLCKPVHSNPAVVQKENSTVSQEKPSVHSEAMEATEEEWTQVSGRRKKNCPL